MAAQARAERRERREAERSRRVRRLVRLSALGCALLLAAAALAGAWVLHTAPRVVSHTPGVAVATDSPRVTVRLTHASSLAARDVTLTVDGRVQVVHVDHGTITARARNLAEGTHRVRLHTAPSGLLGRRVEAGFAFSVDTVAPRLGITSPRSAPAGQRIRSDVLSQRFALRTEPGAHVAITSPAGTRHARAGRSGRVLALATLAEGPQRVRITATDAAGNTARRSVAMLVDASPPKLALAAPRLLTTPRLDVYGNATDQSALSVGFTIDGQDDGVATMTGPDPKTGIVTLGSATDLTEGLHHLTLTAHDTYGHTATLRRTVLVDSTEQIGSNGMGRGARGADVRALQRTLRAKGLFHPAEAQREWNREVYGGGTTAAVRRYQRANGFPADGIAGPDTLAGLVLRIVVNRETHTLTLYRAGRVEKTYRVAVGQPAYPTPAGSFHIVSMQQDPTWTPPKDSAWAKGAKPIGPGPGNPLGTRWMGTDADGGKVGIHGTDDPASIGYSLSHGCIRMQIPDAEDLFERIRVGTVVDIV